MISESDGEAIWAALAAQPGAQMTVDIETQDRTAGRAPSLLRSSTITLGGGSSRGSMTSGSPGATKRRSRSSRRAERRGGRGRSPSASTSPRRPAPGESRPALESQVRSDRMNTLLSASAASRPGGDGTGRTGQVLAIRGGRPLVGRVEVKGAKNLATKAMVAALLGETESVLRDVPDISDVKVVRSLLEVHGVTIEDDGEGVLRLDPSGAVSAHMEEIDAHAGASRIPILFCGPLLHLLGQAFIPDLGALPHRRPPDRLPPRRAARVRCDRREAAQRHPTLSAPKEGLHGADIELPYPSVGATEQVLLTAVRARHPRAAGRGHRPGDHGPDRGAAEDGRDHLLRAQPGDFHRGRRLAARLRPPVHLRPQRGRLVGVRRPCHRRRHLRFVGARPDPRCSRS